MLGVTLSVSTLDCPTFGRIRDSLLDGGRSDSMYPSLAGTGRLVRWHYRQKLWPGG
jgi:hypothetical protein